MDITTALSADLAALTDALGDPVTDPRVDIAGMVAGFATNTRLAVTSFLGLTITITQRTRARSDQVLLRLTLLEDHSDPGNIETSLRMLGPTEQADDQPGIQVVLYAGSPGAFVDMAADLVFLTGQELDAADLDQHQGLAGEPDITGVIQAERIISQAIGVLIAGGRTREQANTELDTLAETAHTDRTTQAARILTALTPGSPGSSHN